MYVLIESTSTTAGIPANQEYRIVERGSLEWYLMNGVTANESIKDGNKCQTE